MSTRWIWVAAVACACGTPPARPRPLADDSPRIVATERDQSGGHLVFIGENGARLADLTRAGAVPVRDDSPAWSPDGERLVFASSRGRDFSYTSLWLVAARPQARIHRLTSGDWIDRDPCWTSDGKSIVFTSNREGSFDLWRAELVIDSDRPPMLDQPVRLTDATSHEFHPSAGPTGKVVYAAADEASGSSLWVVELDGGEPRRLSQGPADLTPSWSPDGEQIAFVASTEKRLEGGGDFAVYLDADLYLMNADGSGRRLLVDEPNGNQNGPRWSHDGRYLFATTVYRSVSGKPALASITFVDLREHPPVLRALHDPALVETRMTPTLAPETLMSTVLHRNPTYGDAIRDLGHDLERRGLLRNSNSE